MATWEQKVTPLTGEVLFSPGPQLTLSGPLTALSTCTCVCVCVRAVVLGSTLGNYVLKICDCATPLRPSKLRWWKFLCVCGCVIAGMMSPIIFDKLFSNHNCALLGKAAHFFFPLLFYGFQSKNETIKIK